MLRLSLALLGATTTASAAMPLELPSVAIPPPILPVPREFKGSASAPLHPFKIPPSREWPILFDLGGLPVNTILGLIDLFGSEDRYRTALAATFVEVVRITSAPLGSTGPDTYTEGEPVKLVGWQAEILQRTLTADSTYIWDTELTERPECIPTYDLRIRLQQGNTTVTAELSLSSRTVRILEGNTFIAEQPLSGLGFGRLLFLAPD